MSLSLRATDKLGKMKDGLTHGWFWYFRGIFHNHKNKEYCQLYPLNGFTRQYPPLHVPNMLDNRQVEWRKASLFLLRAIGARSAHWEHLY